MLLRKLEETGSALYRSLVFPFVRMAAELRTKSVCRQRSYFNRGTVLKGRNYLGKNVYLSHVDLGYGSYIGDRGILKNTRIGRYTSIGPDVQCILGRHPVAKFAAMHPAFYSSHASMGYTYSGEDVFEEQVYIDQDREIQVSIGNDVWIGSGVRIMEGVTIGDGAVVGACALVTKDLEPYGIYGGVPARKLGVRFEDKQAKDLLRTRWWDRDEEWIRAHVRLFDDAAGLTGTLLREGAAKKEVSD